MKKKEVKGFITVEGRHIEEKEQTNNIYGGTYGAFGLKSL